jgi:transcriptional regulator with XRE-family HTH domain
MDELRRLIQAERDKQKLSYREMADRADGLVSYGHLNQIVNGKHTGHLDDRTLKGIALAIDVPVSKVRKAYGTTATEPIEFHLPDRARHLTAKERAAILAMVDAFLESNKRPST